MASQVVGEVESAVSRVPMWGWLALGGGAFAIVMIRHNAANAAANAAAGTVDTGALPGQVFPTDPGGGGAVTPGTTPDPGFQPPATIGPPATYNQKITDIWGNNLQGLIGSFTNQPDYVNLQTGADGSTDFTASNTGTYGGGGNTALRTYSGDAAAYLAQQQAQNAAVAAQQNWYTAYLAQLQEWLKAGQNNPNSGSGGATASAASGIGALIAASCNKGDVTCAKRVAPSWNGSPVPGWSS